MRYRFALLVFPCLLMGQENPTSSKVSLEDAKKYAIAHNFEVTALRRQVDSDRAAVGISNSYFYPTFGAAGGAQSRQSSRANEGNPVGYLYGNYNLFRGFADTYRRQMASSELEASEIRLSKAEFRVGLDVEKQFYLYLLKKIAIELRQKAVTLNESQKKTARHRKAMGLVSDSDVMEFDLRDALLKSDIASLEQEIEEARVNLKRLLGEEIGGKIEPVGELQHAHLKSSLGDLMRRIKEESEAVQIASKDLAKARAEGRIWRSRWLPAIDVEAQAGYLGLDSQVSGSGIAISGQVLARIDLFSGFSTIYERKQAEATVAKFEAQLKQAILMSASQIEVAYRKIKAVEARVHLEEENSERANKYYRSVFDEYKRGVKNSTDLRIAAENVFEAELRRENYKYEFMSQRIELERALGGPVQYQAGLRHED